MKNLYCLLVICIVLSSNSYTKDIKLEDNLKLLGSFGGREIYFSPIPIKQDKESENLVKLYITSGVRTKVEVKVESKGFSEIKYTVANDFITFEIPTDIAQVYNHADNAPAIKDSIFKNSAIRVYSEDPILCYCFMDYGEQVEAFTIIDVPALGKDYIVSSYIDRSDNISEFYPGLVSITAAYDKTKVIFKLGGNDSSRTSGGLISGESMTYNLNAGDVILISSAGEGSDLGGSEIKANKPVAVVSGSYCAYIPDTTGICHPVVEFERPKISFGDENTYHIPIIISKQTNPILRIFAKDSNTTIYRDFEPTGFIKTSGGICGEGFLEMRADTGLNKATVISSDKSIGVSLYCTSYSDDKVISAPFQINLSSTDFYSHDANIISPGNQFGSQYVNIIYESDGDTILPGDIDFASVSAGNFSWQKLNELSPKAGTPFAQKPGGKLYYSKNLVLPGTGVYKIRSSRFMTVYAYGGNYYNSSYGYPASYILGDLTKIDTISPEIHFETGCCGEIVGYVKDLPNNKFDRSNLSTIYMHSDLSYNYRLLPTDFMPCEDDSTAFSLETIDCNSDAKAVISFSDCAGNQVDTVIEYKTSKIKLLIDGGFQTLNYIKLLKNTIADTIIHIINYSSTDSIEINKLTIAGMSAFYSFFDISLRPLNLPIIVAAGDTLDFIMRFRPDNAGVYNDTLYAGDECSGMKKILINSIVINEQKTSDHEAPVMAPDTIADKDPYFLFKGRVVDKPVNDSIRSNLFSVELISGSSFNIAPLNLNFIPCTDPETEIDILPFDPKLDANATLQISDCASNDTTVSYKYDSYKFDIIPDKIVITNAELNKETKRTFWIYNRSNKKDFYIRNFDYSFGLNGFTVYNEVNYPINNAIYVKKNDSAMFIVKFLPTNEGDYFDTLYFNDANINWGTLYLEGSVKATNVNENTQENDVEINLVPANEFLVISLPKQIHIKNIKIYNILGVQRNSHYTENNKRIIINISDLNPGIYFLQMNTNEGTITKKFILE